jgi:hypothetical protein
MPGDIDGLIDRLKDQRRGASPLPFIPRPHVRIGHFRTLARSEMMSLCHDQPTSPNSNTP